jgi:hypothetical protein
MAVAVLQHILIDNYEGASNIYAGMAVAVDESAGSTVVVPADRSDTTLRFLGVSYDDTATSGNTAAVVDPVNPGNYSHDSVTGLDPADYHGPEYKAVAKRSLRDLYDESLGSVVQNWTQGSTRAAKRPIAVVLGGRVKTDQYISTEMTTTSTADGGSAPTFAIESPLTFGAGSTNKGKFVYVDAVGTDGPVVARIVDPAVTTGLLHIRLTGLSENLLS